MGVDLAILTSAEQKSPWPVVLQLLAARGYPLEMRMIDGALAFPDEAPPDDWRELRVGTPGGMVTVRREPGRYVCTVWGNADQSLTEAWHAVAWAFAEATGGSIAQADGVQSAVDFLNSAAMPQALKKSEPAK